MPGLIGSRTRKAATVTVACVALAAFASPVRALASPGGQAGPGVTNVSKCTEAALKSAIARASGNPVDYIVACSVPFTTPITIGASASVDIDANGNTVYFSGGSSHRLFLVKGGTLTLAGLDLIAGVATGQSGQAGSAGAAGDNGADGSPGSDSVGGSAGPSTRGDNGKNGTSAPSPTAAAPQAEGGDLLVQAGTLVLNDDTVSGEAVGGNGGFGGSGGLGGSGGQGGEGSDGLEGLSGQVAGQDGLPGQMGFMGGDATSGSKGGNGGNGGAGGNALGGAVYNAGTLVINGGQVSGTVYAGNGGIGGNGGGGGSGGTGGIGGTGGYGGSGADGLGAPHPVAAGNGANGGALLRRRRLGRRGREYPSGARVRRVGRQPGRLRRCRHRRRQRRWRRWRRCRRGDRRIRRRQRRERRRPR
jgi:hypothetical protein